MPPRRERESAIKRQREAAILRRQLQELDGWKELNPRPFEVEVAKIFKNKGYAVKRSRHTHDEGIDIVVQKDGSKYLVQCKRFKTGVVGRPVLQQLYGTMLDHRAQSGFVVTEYGRQPFS